MASNPVAELVAKVALIWMEKRPFSEEGKARRKARREAKHQRRSDRGSEVPEQVAVALPDNDQVKVVFPDGTEGTRTEPTLNFRSSTKGSWAAAGGFVAMIAAAAPFYPQIDAFVTEICRAGADQGTGGATRALIIATVTGLAVGVPQWLTQRRTKTPMALSAKPPPN